MSQGKRVVLVTNDQAHNLVDTQSLRAQGFHVGEVPGACFCCKFDDLVETVKQLAKDRQPDVIIAEPVGSCTDLDATVLEPLRRWHTTEYTVGPLAVLLKPEHGRRILDPHFKAGFSAKAAYIFLKQIEEAQVVAVNKIDKLSPGDREELLALVRKQFPEKEVHSISARTGEGFQEWIEALCRKSARPESFVELDYDIYAAGEAELGWLNSTVTVRRHQGTMELDDLSYSVVAACAHRLKALDLEPVHLKVLVEATGDVSIANLVGASATTELSYRSGARASEATVTINARVIADPVSVEGIVGQVLDELAERRGVEYTVDQMQRFRPARPEPTHRLH